MIPFWQLGEGATAADSPQCASKFSSRGRHAQQCGGQAGEGSGAPGAIHSAARVHCRAVFCLRAPGSVFNFSALCHPHLVVLLFAGCLCPPGRFAGPCGRL